ncbi:hypothetical protein NUACC21_40360 [Scytonema sp. NUACC21]
MSQFLPQQSKFSTRSFVKLGLISLALSLSLGTHSRAHAEQVEIISVPPQEAFFVEDKTAATSDKDDSGSKAGETLTDETMLPGMRDNLETWQHGNTANSSSGTSNSSKQVQM